MTVNGGYDTAISDKDQECYKHSYKVETERKIGGNSNIKDLDEWLASCTPENPNSCALLGYSFGVNGDNDSGLIPLYELFSDEDPRKGSMKEALDEYIKENTINLETCPLVITDVYGRYSKSGNPEVIYNIDGKHEGRMYLRLNDNMFSHVKGSKKGSFYFYYALEHLVDGIEAVTDIKFEDNEYLGGNWDTRGGHSNEGITGCLDNRYVCVKRKKHTLETNPKDFVTGFGVNVDGRIGAISEYAKEEMSWKTHSDSKNWYSAGLVHDNVKCIYTKDELKP